MKTNERKINLLILVISIGLFILVGSILVVPDLIDSGMRTTATGTVTSQSWESFITRTFNPYLTGASAEDNTEVQVMTPTTITIVGTPAIMTPYGNPSITNPYSTAAGTNSVTSSEPQTTKKLTPTPQPNMPPLDSSPPPTLHQTPTEIMPPSDVPPPPTPLWTPTEILPPVDVSPPPQ